MVAPLLLAAAPALISGAAAIGGNMMQSSAIQGANKQARKFAREQREWDLAVASTAHQRQVEDMRAAGLNPILSATGGSGAPSPQAPGAQVLPEMGNMDVGGAMAEGFNSGMAVQMREAELNNLEANWENTKVDTSLKASQQLLQGTAADIAQETYGDQIASARAVRERAEAEAENARKLGRQLDQQYQIGQSAEAQSRIDQEIYSKVPFLRWLDAISRSVQGIGGAAGSLRR